MNLNWIMGYGISQKDFPKGWNTTKTQIITSVNTIAFDSDVMTLKQMTQIKSAVIGCTTLNVIDELLSGKHIIAVSKDQNQVIVEYHKADQDVILVVYDRADNHISAREYILNLEDGSLTQEISILCDKKSSAAEPIYMALLVACLLDLKKPHVDDIVNSLQAVFCNPIVKSVADTAYKGIAEWVFLLNSAMVKILSENGLPDGVENWIGKTIKGIEFNEVDNVNLMELREHTTFPFMDAVRSNSGISKIVEGFNLAPISNSILLFYDENEVMPEKQEGMTIETLKSELALDIHPLTEREKKMVPVLSSNYVIDAKLLNVARKIKADWKYPGLDLAPNFILEGDAGSGKTAATKFFAAVFGLPRTKMTMNPFFESSDLIGSFFPVFNGVERWKLPKEDQDAITYIEENVSISSEKDPSQRSPEDVCAIIEKTLENFDVRQKLCDLYHIPDATDCQLSPAEAWEQMGYKGEHPNVMEIMSEASKRLDSKLLHLTSILFNEVSSKNVSYRFILSELMQAFQNGWLVEIQEAASILRPGVLTQLNSLMELGGRIELPNGSYVMRHPDTIVVITTNRGYAGNADINESLRDRCMLGVKMDLPPVEVMADRAMAQVGLEEEKRPVALAAAEIIMKISEEAKARNIRGSFGMRSLEAWLLDLKRGDFSEESFRQRVIEKMTSNDEDIELLMSCYRAECKFTSKGKFKTHR